MTRRAKIARNTKETQINLELAIDGTGQSAIDTPVPFLNHMLESFARHGVMDLTVQARGDTEIDDHHTVEDIGLCLGQALRESAPPAGITRFGHFTLPMDDTLVTVAVDFCNRPAFVWKVPGLERKRVGTFDCELAHEFFAAVCQEARCNLHMLLHYGANAHHIIEALFKATARAIDQATTFDDRLKGAVPSTKGTLTD